jgi:uncharacterized protein (TIGR03066 family)
VRNVCFLFLSFTLALTACDSRSGMTTPSATPSEPAKRPAPADHTLKVQPERSDKERIVGTWEQKTFKSTQATMVFTSEGGFKSIIKLGDTLDIGEGTYELVGDKLHISAKQSNGEQKTKEYTIIKLTESQLIIGFKAFDSIPGQSTFERKQDGR